MADSVLATVTDRLADLAKQLIGRSTAIPKSVAKLIDTVGEQAGLIAAPHHVRRNADAQAAAAITLAKAGVEVETIQKEGTIALAELDARAAVRMKARESRRQKNIEGALRRAALALPEHVSDEPVDPDWVAQFFDGCQDIGDAQMQILWGRLLAGEVAAPGTFSRQTLATVRLLSKPDADLFTRLCSGVWTGDNSTHPIVDFPHEMSNALGFGGGLDRLEALGLISIVLMDLRMEWKHPQPIVLKYFGRTHRLTFRQPIRPPALAATPPAKLTYPCGRVLLTHIGKELVPVAGAEPNEAYRQSVVKMFRTHFFAVEDGPEVQPTSDRQE
jgi:hypothetical protein